MAFPLRRVPPDVIPLPVHRCPQCWYVGRTASFEVGEGGPWEGQSLVCPRCGTAVGRVDPRLA